MLSGLAGIFSDLYLLFKTSFSRNGLFEDPSHVTYLEIIMAQAMIRGKPNERESTVEGFPTGESTEGAFNLPALLPK